MGNKANADGSPVGQWISACPMSEFTPSLRDLSERRDAVNAGPTSTRQFPDGFLFRPSAHTSAVRYLPCWPRELSAVFLLQYLARRCPVPPILLLSSLHDRNFKPRVKVRSGHRRFGLSQRFCSPDSCNASSVDPTLLRQ